MNIDQKDFGTLAICAIRYCQGRQTYMPSLVQGIVIKHLNRVSDNDLAIMTDDCDFQATMNLWGDERIDRPGWERWREALIDEKRRRER